MGMAVATTPGNPKTVCRRPTLFGWSASSTSTDGIDLSRVTQAFTCAATVAQLAAAVKVRPSQQEEHSEFLGVPFA
jgi:hypothetical protein